MVLVRSAIACTWLVAATKALLQTRKEIKRVEILAMTSYMPRCTIWCTSWQISHDLQCFNHPKWWRYDQIDHVCFSESCCCVYHCQGVPCVCWWGFLNTTCGSGRFRFCINSEEIARDGMTMMHLLIWTINLSTKAQQQSQPKEPQETWRSTQKLLLFFFFQSFFSLW